MVKKIIVGKKTNLNFLYKPVMFLSFQNHVEQYSNTCKYIIRNQLRYFITHYKTITLYSEITQQKIIVLS